jgi:hypothetical protein
MLEVWLPSNHLPADFPDLTVWQNRALESGPGIERLPMSELVAPQSVPASGTDVLVQIVGSAGHVEVRLVP